MDWYEAVVISNTLLGDAFPIDETCVFRHINLNEMKDFEDLKSSKKFEVFNLKTSIKILSGDEAKSQLRSLRDSKNNVIRARDQGYIDWKYTNIGID